MIREFFAALARALEKNEVEAQSEAVHELYRQYLGSYEFFQNATIEEAMDYIETHGLTVLKSEITFMGDKLIYVE